MKNITKSRLSLECITIGILCIVLSSLISLFYQQINYVPENNVKWQPIDDIVGIFTIMPYGIVFHFFMPWGWPCWVGLILSLKFKQRKYYFLTALSSILFGITWPKLFWAWMSV